MQRYSFVTLGILTSLWGYATGAVSESSTIPDQTEHNGCYQVGPQTPRDIDNPTGTNPVLFSVAPDHTRLNLCNIHFHANAEHRAKAFSIHAEPDAMGYQCSLRKNLTARELQPASQPACLQEYQTG